MKKKLKLYNYCKNCNVKFNSPREKGICNNCQLLLDKQKKIKGVNLNDY